MSSQEPEAGDGQPLLRTDIVVALADVWETSQLHARDSSTGEFRPVSFTMTAQPRHPPDVRPQAFLRFHSLSPDGSQLLVGEPHHYECLVPLAPGAGPGRFVPFPPEPDRPPALATLAPDGIQVAAMTTAGDQSTDDNRVILIVVDTGSGQARELWSARGAPTSDAVVTWSPDGLFIAVTWVDGDDFSHSAVVDRAGTVVADLPHLEVLGEARPAWTGDHELLLFHEYWDDDIGPEPIVLLDPATGHQRQIECPGAGGVHGALDGRLLIPSPDGGIVSTAFDGSDPRTLVTFEADLHVTFFDATPGALDAHGPRHVPDIRTKT